MQEKAHYKPSPPVVKLLAFSFLGIAVFTWLSVDRRNMASNPAKSTSAPPKVIVAGNIAQIIAKTTAAEGRAAGLGSTERKAISVEVYKAHDRAKRLSTSAYDREFSRLIKPTLLKFKISEIDADIIAEEVSVAEHRKQ